MKRKLIDAFPFEIDARIPLQLGRESISSSMVAISELVKNSYDADATEVTLEFLNLGTSNPSLIILDNGIGMSQKSFKDNWLRIGTTNKTKNIRSGRLKRVLTGAKGLGRLGVDRLSHELILHTKTKSARSAYELNVQWSKYEKKDISLSDVKHKFYEHEIPINDEFGNVFNRNNSEGTRITLVGLKDKWDETTLLNLRQQLSFLVSPFSSVNDFEIEIKTGLEDIDGKINSETVLEDSLWKIDAVLKKNGSVTVNYKDCVRNKNYSMKSIPWSEFSGPDVKEKPACGPFSFSMYYIPFDAPKHWKDPSFNKKDIKEFMVSNQGIRIYRDGFRVRPYGEPDNSGDWLGLAARAARSPGGIAQGGWRVGLHQVVGAVQIGRIENPNLCDQTNREGIIESEFYYEMKSFVLSVISGFETKAHKAAKKEKDKIKTEIEESEANVIAASEKSKSTLDEIKQKIDGIKFEKSDDHEHMSEKISDFVTHISKLEKEIQDVEEANKQSKQAYEERSKVLETEKNTLGNLASLGILSIAFGHETTQYAIGAAGNAKQLKHAFEKGKMLLGPDHEDSFRNSIDTIIRNTSFIKNFTRFYLSSVRPSRRKRRAVPVADVLRRTVDVLSSSLDRQNITVDIEMGNCQDVKVSAFEIDIESIFVNFFTNSIQAMSRTQKNNRLIKVFFSRSDEVMEIVFSDSGSGISKVHLPSIFEPMFSTKKDSKGNQEGTGMGLTIIKTIIEEHIKGGISVAGKGKLGGAEFFLKMPIKNKV